MTRSSPARIGHRWSAWIGLALGLSGCLPAAAELKVQVSRTTTGRYESVGIRVTDPLGGLDARPGPITVTMADGADRRQAIQLEPTGRPGEWVGRFTPVRTGRYTGTAVLERDDEKEIGLVPLVRVGWSKRPGFVRLHPTSRRVLTYSQGGTLFPVGVSLHAEDLLSLPSWAAEMARLRRSGANYLEAPLLWSADRTAEEDARLLRAVDMFLLAAEQAGLVVQLRFTPAAPLTEQTADGYREQLGRWVRRWCYSPAVAAWVVCGTEGEYATSTASAVRAADAYGHLVAMPRRKDGPAVPPGADLASAPWNWGSPAQDFALFDVVDYPPGVVPLPGETSWQFLAVGGVGLPLWPYRPGSSGAGALLQRLARLSEAAKLVPYTASPQPVSGFGAADEPAAAFRYGQTIVGWAARSGQDPFLLPALNPGRYRVRLWDPRTDARLPEQSVTVVGSRRAALVLPSALQAVAFVLQPVPPSERGSSPPGPSPPRGKRPRG